VVKFILRPLFSFAEQDSSTFGQNEFPMDYKLEVVGRLVSASDPDSYAGRGTPSPGPQGLGWRRGPISPSLVKIFTVAKKT
jgi:hypothetical protein